tara:strand:+ start:1996 stop:2250 length:255 start_codon:yes stop_codon:yes gene_type:complete
MTVKNAQVSANSWTLSFWLNYKDRTYKVLADVDVKIQSLEIEHQTEKDATDNDLMTLAMNMANKIVNNMDYETLTLPYNIQTIS